MRHFGEPAQDLNLRESGADTSLGSLTPLPSDNRSNLARLIHDRFSPANLYEQSSASLNRADGAAQANSVTELNFNANPYDTNRIVQQSDRIAQTNDRVISQTSNLAAAQFERTVPITALPQLQQPAAHPLLASLRRPDNQGEVKFPVPELAAQAERDNAPREALARKVVYDFKPNIFDSKFGIRNDIMGRDPFGAPNCYQSYQINAAEGWSRTVTTLPDLSASKIETRYPDRNTITFTDRLGRPEREQVLDKQGNVLTETQSRFEHAASPTIASYKMVKTANETIEMTFDRHGNVTSKYTV